MPYHKWRDINLRWKLSTDDVQPAFRPHRKTPWAIST